MQRSKNPTRAKRVLFWSLVAGVVITDVITKLMAVTSLVPRHVPREVFGEWVRLTLVFNRGAAFGLHLGPWSRGIFLVLTIVALVILGQLYRATRPVDRIRLVALGLVCGGAIGNLIDRIRSPLGVVDFLDIGFRDWRWPTFNVADIAVSCGALLLAWVLWGEEKEAASRDAAVAEPEGMKSVGQ
jgi:signal peptidase II